LSLNYLLQSSSTDAWLITTIAEIKRDMSSLPSRNQAPNSNNNSSDDNGDRQRSIVFAWIISVGLVLLIVLFVSPGWLVPHIEATEDNTTPPQVEEIDDDTAQVEEIDGGIEETDDFPVDVQPLSNETMSVNDNTDAGTNEPVVIVPVTQIDTTPNNVNDEVISTTNDENKTTTTGGGGSGGGNSHSSHGASGDGDADDNAIPVDDEENAGEEDNGGQNESESDEGCTVQYWQNHPESWPEPLIPTTSFSSVFGITIPGMEELTLMDALGLEGDLVNELLSEGSAGILNAAHHDIHYFKSQETVINNMVDGLDPQVVQSGQYTDDNDIEERLSKFVTENYRGCPLLVNE
jgi:hypothetical protein